MPKRKRVAKVTDLIVEGLCRLVEKDEPSYSELTVQDIVDEAGVCRNSFYRNYTGKDDIFRKRYYEIIQVSDDALPTDFDYFDVFRSAARIFEQNQRFFRCFYRTNPAAYFETITSQIIRSNATGDVVTPQEYYLFAARAWTGIGLLTEWLQKGCDLSSDTLIEVLKSFFSEQ